VPSAARRIDSEPPRGATPLSCAAARDLSSLARLSKCGIPFALIQSASFLPSSEALSCSLCSALYPCFLVRRWSTREHYPATIPPSATRGWPVTKEAASEQSQSAASAISSGAPIRPIGSMAVNCASVSGFLLVMRSTIGV
jgi:hypothetical protein